MEQRARIINFEENMQPGRKRPELTGKKSPEETNNKVKNLELEKNIWHFREIEGIFNP